LAVLLMAIAVGYIHPQFSRAEATHTTVATFLAQLLLLPGLFPQVPILTVSWTLSYIIAGYLLFPIVGFALRRANTRRSLVVLFWCAVTAVVFTAGLTGGPLSIRFAYIPAGCLIFAIQAEPRDQNKRRGVLRGLLAVAGLSLLLRVALDGELVEADWPPTVFRALYTLNGLILVASLTGLGLLIQRRYPSDGTSRSLALVAGYGRTGYSFYLLHGPVVKVFAMLVFPLLATFQASAAAYWLVMPFCWAASAAAAYLLYRLVERPSRNLLMRPLGSLLEPALPRTLRLEPAAVSSSPLTSRVAR
jgi:peptidoglycan/LPS O-acetylase OafA/YrhL